MGFQIGEVPDKMEKYVLIYEEWNGTEWTSLKVYFNDRKTLQDKVDEFKTEENIYSIVFAGLIKEEYNHDVSS